jgi:transcription-repair coupling factor (superfamily II helicase)
MEDVRDSIEALAGVFAQKASVAAFGEDSEGRMASLEALHRGAAVAVASAKALEARVPPAAAFASRRFPLRPGQACRKALVERLAGLGYRRVDFVEDAGEFAVRGAVVDFFPPEPPVPVRVLFSSESVESLRAFDPETQGVLPALLDEAAAVPVAEGDAACSLGERLRGEGLWIVEEGASPAQPSGECLLVGLPREPCLDLGSAAPPAFAGDVGRLSRQCVLWRREGTRVLLFSLNRGEDERMQDLLDEEGVEPGAVQFLIGPLRRGYLLPSASLAVLSAEEAFGRSYRPMRRWGSRAASGGRLRFGELRKGDFVVHADHGIGRYAGIETVRIESGGVDCIRLEYRGSDRLFIPMGDFSRVQKFVGAEGHKPRLSSLDSRRWEEVQDRVREGVRELAGKMLEMEARRSALEARAFGADTRMEAEFSESFPYEETPDQLRAISEVLSDMGLPRPMDRVVVGDVGFGKTEVAMRAALKCAAGGAQTAVLVPTTILADQHLRSFRRRFAEYPVRVEVLSRFQRPSDQRAVLEGMASGAVDVVIGTHRLLQADVRFKDLGLLVIDEEHRFGVSDKERLKSLKSDVHCLTLSATPIPRTLYQALSGLRAVSLIRSAPSGRLPIATELRAFDLRHAASAVAEEIARGGQAFFVHNRVASLPARVEDLRRSLPGARVVMAHGQMRAGELERVMWDFFQGKHDVLAASTIIESGLDIPTVNTLLIENAHEFGLSQLYQLRGRIGRERRRAYCCLYTPAGEAETSALGSEARSRLAALREFTQLGAGFQLAMRDLEIRGAGDLLGARQHGNINSVGLEFYCEMLRSEVERLRRRAHGGVPAPPAPPPEIDLGPAFIPEDYLPGDLRRIEFYKRLLAAGAQALPALERELRELSGPEPEPVSRLFRIMRLRHLGAKRGVRAVSSRSGFVEVHFRRDARPPASALAAWMDAYRGRIEFLRSPEGDGVRVHASGEDPIEWLEGFLG